MSKALLFAILCCITGSHSLFAQDILIQYNNADSSTRYYKVDANGNRRLENKLPYAKKNKRIIVQILNVNPFAYNINHQISQRSITYQFDSTKNLIPYLANNLKTFENEIGSLQGIGAVGTTQSKGIEIDDYMAALRKSQDIIMIIDNKFSKWQSTYDVIKRQLLATNLSKETILQNIDSTLRADFLINSSKGINTRDSIRRNYRELMTNLKRFKADYATASPVFNQAQDKLKINTLIVANTEVDSLIKAYSSGQFIAKLYSIDDILFLAKNAVFTYSFEDIADQDYTDITVNIIKKQARIDADSLPDIQAGQTTTKKYRVINKGENVIRSSIGIAFPTLFKNAVRYDIEDSKVKEFQDNNFVPNLTTFINFYPFRGKFSNFGGVLGFGYPLTSESKSINIMLGASQTFGDKNSFLLSAGVNFGQTNRLSSGWSVGKTVTDENVTIPTTKEWKVGAYIGLSIGFFNR